ncbi:MAG: hypothetical protein JXB23_14950 [Candidatus Aminicenantes bacterium]|nr:hypothetical protein [Candidatus Aminicenantes bacterium]
MKTCPYCGRSFHDSEAGCPACGAPYWEANRSSSADSSPSPDEDQGCFTIILIQLLVALGFAAFLILLGFLINLIVHFEANQVKIVWIGTSLLFGGLLSLLIKKFRKRGEIRQNNHKSRTKGR